MTKPLKSTAVVAILTLTVAGCVPSPEDFETTPVQVRTDKGIVTCQLYRPDRVIWDRAIDFPATQMSVREADQVCRQEGQRRLNQ